ncbi:HEPN/Toprim-associated domain-containing protein [Streptomyces sp. NPDC006335]|uniref:HEPN/Toprim-associated domain-containing protein n=1 Tax=Streptomyces sp. NPDC006335 TaxID=3156895 RepID=UPI0033AD5800
MGEYSGIYVGGKEIFTYRNEMHLELEDLFSRQEATYLVGEDAVPYSSAWHAGNLDCEVGDVEVYGLCASIGALKERLNTLGFGYQVMQSSVRRLLKEEIEQSKRFLEQYEGRKTASRFQESLRRKIQDLSNLNFEEWQARVSSHIAKKQISSPDWRESGPLDIFQGADSRILMRVLVEHFPDDFRIFLDLTDYIEDAYPINEAGEWMPVWQLDAAPPIVITEGSFDAAVLRSAIAILRPHLAPYIRFLDYSVGNEGGAAAAVRTLKSFAAAGISHRIVAIFDNDSAAYEAVLALRPNSIPAHYGVMHYPHLPLAEAYPTLGPQGDSVMDVNGLAGSIELYLGRDVLEGENGTLAPVQWKGYMHKVGAYQGEVTNKGPLQNAFRAKVDEALANPEVARRQDWSGLELILDALVEKLSNLPAARPYVAPLSIADFTGD